MTGNPKIRVRFAPSPTGELHIGGLRTALYDWLFARKNNGSFIVRIEDTDQARQVQGAEERIIKLLEQFGLDYDEGPNKDGGFGPYRQSERLDIYQKHVMALIEQKNAYYCTCSSERLDQMREEQKTRGLAPKYDGLCRDKYSSAPAEQHVIRMRLPDDGEIVVHDELRGDVKFEYSTLDDFVLMKADGYPTYHLACVVDDHLMQISHVIRGEEWFPSLPKHIALYYAFGWEAPRFIHPPLILGKDRQKLSKRHGSTNAQSYLDDGYLPEAILNFIALLGWHPGDDKEIYTIPELINAFSLDRLQKSPAIFDTDKLDWMNSKLIRSMDVNELAKISAPFIESRLLTEFKNKINDALILVKDRIKTLSELPELLSFLTADYSVDPDDLPFKSTTSQITRDALQFSDELLEKYDGTWTINKLEVYWKNSIQKKELAIGVVLWPLRVALTGKKASPGTFEVLQVLGKEISKKRISHAIDSLKNR